MRLDPTTAAGIDSPIGAALALLAERDISRDVERPLLDLSQAAPPYPPAPEVVERVVEVARAPDGAAYTPVPGIPPLRRAIADELSRDYAGTVEPSDVVVTAGCNQAFSLVADALDFDAAAEVIHRLGKDTRQSAGEHSGRGCQREQPRRKLSKAQRKRQGRRKR